MTNSRTDVAPEDPQKSKQRLNGALSRMSSQWWVGSTSTEKADGAKQGRSRTLRIVVGLFLGYGYYNTMRGTLPQQMRHIARDLDIPLDRVGLPSSLFSAAYGFGKFSTSVLSDFVPCSEFHAVGIFLSGLAVASLGLCSDLQGLACLWGVQGLVQAFGWPFLARVVVAELPEKDRAKYWGVLSMAGNVGNMITPYGMVLAAAFGLTWRGAFLGAGCSAGAVSLLVAWLLCGNRHEGAGSPVAAAASAADPAAPRRGISSTLVVSAASVWTTPVLLVCMACNMLSFGSSKCIKEWGPVYLRSTGLAASDMQTATLLFWAEVGGSCGAFCSGFLSTRLGGRHALTCVLSAVLGTSTLGALAWCSYRAMSASSGASAVAPMPFPVACLLQALGMAGVSGVRTLAGLHGAELASRRGMVGMANGWMEMVGQVGSVMSGQPLGALAARVAVGAAASSGAAAASGVSKASLMDVPAGGVTILVALMLASLAMAVLNLSLMPQEARWIASKAGKTD